MFDVAIVGAGVIGCSIARHLSKFNINVLVIDQANDVAQGASKANSGIVHGGYDERNGTMKAAVSHRGNQMFAQLQRELHFGFRRTGSLVVAFDSDGIDILAQLKENGAKNGVDDLVLITDRNELLRLEPNLSDKVVAAMFCKHSGITSPYEYTIALAENAFTNGVDFKLCHKVVGISAQSPFTITCVRSTDKQTVTFDSHVVINCAGIKADKVAGLVGVDSFKIVPRKGEYLVLDRSQGSLVNRVLFPVPDPKKGKGILVSPTYWGNLLIGPTSRPLSDTMQRQDILEEIIGRAHELVPCFDIRRTITSYAGLRAKSDTRDFIIEESRVKRFINVAGIDSPGLTSSPAIALDVFDLVRKTLPFVVSQKQNFYSHRPSIIQLPKPHGFKGRIDHPDPELNIICRCEEVTQAEIEDCIHRPLGGHTIAAVKKRTRCGMGYCQGKFCEPRVKKILSVQLNVPQDQIESLGPGTSLLSHQRPTEEDRAYLAKLDKLAKSKLSGL